MQHREVKTTNKTKAVVRTSTTSLALQRPSHYRAHASCHLRLLCPSGQHNASEHSVLSESSAAQSSVVSIYWLDSEISKLRTACRWGDAVLQAEHTPQQAHSSASHIICKNRIQTLANIHDGVASRARSFCFVKKTKLHSSYPAGRNRASHNHSLKVHALEGLDPSTGLDVNINSRCPSGDLNGLLSQ